MGRGNLKRTIAVFSTLAMLSLAGAVARAESGDFVTVAKVAGAVETMHKDATHGKWIAAAVDQQLTGGWSLRTLDESKAQLIFPMNNVVTLKANSVLKINELAKGGGAHLETTKGGLLVQIKNHLDSGAEFTLDTPTAQAIVRGTEYGVQIEDDGTDANGDPITQSRFYGYEGKVEVKNDKGSQFLEKGNTLVSELDKIPGIPVASLAEALDFFNDLSSDALFKKAEQAAKQQVQKPIDKALGKAKRKLKFP